MILKTITLIFTFILFSILNMPLLGQKPVLAVLNLKGEDVASSESRIITNFIQEAMFKTEMYELVDRTQVEQILKEFEYQQSGICDVKCAVKVGKQLAANKVLMGTVGKLGNFFVIQVKIVSIETSKIEKIESVRTQCELGDLPDHISKLAHSLCGISTKLNKSINKQEKNIVKRNGEVVIESNESRGKLLIYCKKVTMVTSFWKWAGPSTLYVTTKGIYFKYPEMNIDFSIFWGDIKKIKKRSYVQKYFILYHVNGTKTKFTEGIPKDFKKNIIKYWKKYR